MVSVSSRSRSSAFDRREGPCHSRPKQDAQAARSRCSPRPSQSHGSGGRDIGEVRGRGERHEQTAQLGMSRSAWHTFVSYENGSRIGIDRIRAFASGIAGRWLCTVHKIAGGMEITNISLGISGASETKRYIDVMTEGGAR